VADPLYRKIADELYQQIEAGQLGPESQLPTESDLQREYGASRNTIRDAIKWLIARGVVETRPGQGTFVVPRINPFATTLSGKAETSGSSELDLYISTASSEGRQLRVSPPRVQIQRAYNEIAEMLGIAEGNPVISRHQELSIDGTPWALQTTFYPMDFVTRGAFRLIETQNLPGGTLSYLKKAIRVNQVAWRDSITVRAPENTEIDFFRLPYDLQVFVFEIRRTGFDADGPIRLTITIYPTDRNQFLYEEGPIPRSAKPPDETLQPSAERPTRVTG
jgi:GntR family transcriptional regulator